MRITTRILAVLAGFVLAGLAPAAEADEPYPSGITIGIQETDFLTLGAGGFDINDDQTSGEFRLEYRSDYRLWFIKPIVGVLANTDGGAFGYGGFGFDI
ncbi:MAG: acyloxyacyl hydrolase, partial [Proteobacteria bacterium]|nr:acyloxyacyl hydrolase [Pseudomonadota bacterium]